MDKNTVSRVLRLKNLTPGIKFVFEEDDDEYRRFEHESDKPAIYMRIAPDATCSMTSTDSRLDVPIVCIDWHNKSPIGKIRYVSGQRTVIARN